jgi:transcriptional regulator with XRE-family HTH domain
VTDSQREVLRPSQVFARRLHELRESRGRSLSWLAERMQAAGFEKMGKAGVLRVEKAERGLSLDEALAFAQVFYAAPAHLLTPHEGTGVAITNQLRLDNGQEIRTWFSTGHALPVWPETPGTEDRAVLDEFLNKHLEVYAENLVDALRARPVDVKGVEIAKDAIKAVVYRHREAVQSIDVGSPGRSSSYSIEPAPLKVNPTEAPDG